jgi:hypothetical protein
LTTALFAQEPFIVPVYPPELKPGRIAYAHLRLVLLICVGLGCRSVLVFSEGKGIEQRCLRCLILDIHFSILNNLYFLQNEKIIPEKHNYQPKVLIDSCFYIYL